jgi:hypothetical protein
MTGRRREARGQAPRQGRQDCVDVGSRLAQLGLGLCATRYVARLSRRSYLILRGPLKRYCAFPELKAGGPRPLAAAA